MTTCRRFTFTTTVRVIDRVHDHTANGRTNTAPAHCTSFTDLAQAVLGITDFTNRCTAFHVDTTNLARTQTNLCVNTFTRHQHNTSACGTCNLSTFTWQHFDAVNSGTHRDIANRQSITCLDRSFRTAQQLIADCQTLAGNDVTTLTIRVQQQCDVSRTVRIVFNTLHFRRNTILVALEVDNTIVLTVTTTDMTGGDVAVVITASRFRFLFDQTGKWTAFVQVVINDLDHATTTWRGRLDFNECHYLA